MSASFAYQGREVKPTPRRPPPAIGSTDCRATRGTPAAADLQAVLIDLFAAGGQTPIVECSRLHQRIPIQAAVARAGGNRLRAARELGVSTAGLGAMLRRWRREDETARHRMAALVREAS